MYFIEYGLCVRNVFESRIFHAIKALKQFRQTTGSDVCVLVYTACADRVDL